MKSGVISRAALESDSPSALPGRGPALGGEIVVVVLYHLYLEVPERRVVVFASELDEETLLQGARADAAGLEALQHLYQAVHLLCRHIYIMVHGHLLAQPFGVFSEESVAV